MTSTPDTIRVFIPLTIRRRNGRPRILPPANMEAAEPRTQDPHVLRAIACAWGWRRKIEIGEVATIRDIAVAEKVLGAVCQPHDALGLSLTDCSGEARRPPPAMLALNQGSHRRGRAAMV